METIQYSWGLIFYNLLFNFISVVSMSLNILSVTLIKNCFLGGNLKFNKKTVYRAFSIVPAFMLFSVIEIIIYLVSCGWDFSKPVEVNADSNLWSILVKLLIFGVVFFTSFVLYDKKRFLHSIGLYLSIVIIEFYFQGLVMYSVAYFSESPYKTVASIAELKVGDDYVYTFILLYFVIILCIFLIMYYGFYAKRKYIYISWGYRIFFIFWILIIGIIPMIPISKEDEGGMYRMMGYAIGIMIPLLILGVPLFIIAMVSRRFAVEKTELQEKYIDNELEYINQYKRNQSETRAFRHDIVNNLSLLSMLMENGKTDEAKEHLESLLGNIKALSPKYNTGDEMLDCIVTMKASVMEEKGIAFTMDGVADGGLNMKPVDICSLFSNALDNAIDACIKIPQDKERKVLFEIKRTGTFFNIRIENSITDSVKGLTERLFEEWDRFTTKENKNLHGYGSRNMKQIVSNYDGMIKAEIADLRFILTIMIPRK
ncbi:MAG: GHKL domain-containing protein [Lachnospiraceae bacterium]|nr:GHKL domain-containing protein [Lachnospiraceae bacterium]